MYSIKRTHNYRRIEKGYVDKANSQDNSIEIVGELFSRLRKFYASFFLTALFIALMPREFLDGNFTLKNYSPAIYFELSVFLDYSVTRMIKHGSVQIVVSSPLSVISASIQLALIISFILNFPLLAYQFYNFIAPGLYINERKALKKGIWYLSALFFLGAWIAYFLVVPITLGVLTTISIPLITISDSPLVLYFTLDSIFTIVIWTVFSAGLLYTIPGIIYILIVADIVDVNYLIDNRKNVILAILILAAVITPDPTMISMLIISGPLIIINEIVIHQGLQIKKTQTKRAFGGEFIS